MKKIKVFYVADWYIDTIYPDLLNNLGKDIELTMIVSDKYPNYSRNKFKVKVFPTYGLSKISEYTLAYKKQLFDFIDKEKPDLVIVNLWFTFSTFQVTDYCIKKDIPYIIQDEMKAWPKNVFLNGYARILTSPIRKRMMRHSKFILPWTEQGKEFYIRNRWADEKKIIVMPAGINVDLYKKNTSHIDKIRHGETKILMVARNVPYKRHIDLLKAAKYLREHTSMKFKITLVGRGPKEKYIDRLIKKFDLSNIVTIIRKVPREDMVRLYSTNDILVLPSYNEAIGMVVPEAMACGMSVIVSDTCGAKTYVNNGKNGYIFKTYDYKDLAKKISELDSKQLRNKIAKNAVADIKRSFDAKILSKQFRAIMIRSIKQ